MFFLRILIACCWVIALPNRAGAETFPSKPVTVIVPFAAGGLTDGLARALSQRLSEKWRQPVIVDNRAGGGTVIGTAAAARAPADGHTLLLTSFGFIANQVMLPNLPYAPGALEPLVMVADAPSVLFVHPSVPADNVAELVRYLKSQTTPLPFASSGNGSSPHIAAELFASLAEVEITHVPYRGNGPALTDLIGGQVKAMFDSLAALSYVKAGKLKAIGIASTQRSSRAPDLVPIAESGVVALNGFSAGSWFGLFVPSGTPRELQQKLFADIRAVLDTKDMRDAIVKAGVEPVQISQAQFAGYLKAELDKWGPVIRAKNIRPD